MLYKHTTGIFPTILEFNEGMRWRISIINCENRGGFQSISTQHFKTIVLSIQALSQCTQYCAQMGFQMEEHDDTAGAAADLVKHQWRGVAAIASSRAAEIYGLKILKQGIQVRKS